MPYPYKTMREWILEEEKLGEVLRIKKPIKCGDYNNIVDIGNDIPGKQPETEMRAVTRYLHSLPGKPMALVEKPVNNRPDLPVLLNPWATNERTYRSLGVKDKNGLSDRFLTMRAKPIKPVTVTKKKAPCKEIIIPEKKLDLRTDIPRCWVEFNQMLWSGCNGTIVVYAPETGNHDIGKVRFGQYDWKEGNPDNPYPEEMVRQYGFATLQYLGAVASNAGRYYYQNYRTKNKPMPAAIIFGLPADIHTVAALKTFKFPENDDYAYLGGLRREALEIVESETIPGLMVPAHTEWVIEGEFLPEDEKMPPYAEDIATGYMFGGEYCPKFKVKCITRQKDAWWTDATFSSTGMNGHTGPHVALAAIQSEADALNYLRGIGYKVKDINTLDTGREVVVIQLEVDGATKPHPWYGKQVAMALRANYGTYCGPPAKYIIVVGPDIDPYDFKDVMWAMGTRTMPVSDSIMIEKGICSWGDPGGVPGPQGWRAYGEQMMIDALIKIPERHETFAPRSEPVEWEKEAIRRMKARLERR